MSFQHRFVQGLGVEKRTHPPHLLGRILLAITLLVLGTQAASADVSCTESNGQWRCSCTPKKDNNGQFIYQSLDDNNQKPWKSAQTAPDLEVSGWCRVPLSQTLLLQKCQHPTAKPMYLQFCNFMKMMPEGSSNTHFWASSIIIENGGAIEGLRTDQALAAALRLSWRRSDDPPLRKE